MTMGERIRAARSEAGLSQRQLAGDEITRNMLSALEHDGANPSVATLKYLSDKLCKPISYFLGEDIPTVPEAEEMAQARAAYQSGDFPLCLSLLKDLKSENFRQERLLLESLSAMALARQALKENRLPYAHRLLAQSHRAGEESLYFTEALRREWLLLAAQAARRPGERAALLSRLPDEDEVLLLKAQTALSDGNLNRAQRLLDAAENQSTQWFYLRAEYYFAQKDYARAAECYHRAEPDINADRRLEICHRELGDYKMAYYYATKSIMNTPQEELT